MDKFWQFKNLSLGEGELLLYGEISSEKPWWSDDEEGIYPKQFADDLKSLGNINNLTVRLNSPGGDVYAAQAIYTQLKSHPANVTAVIDGIAASAATIIMAAADTIKAPSNAMIMIHDPLLSLWGNYNSEDMSKMMDVLSTVKNSIINAYVSKTGLDKADLAEMMKNETWLTGSEAKDKGFVDEIMFEENIDAAFTNDGRFFVVNSIAHDMRKFHTLPKLVTNHQTRNKNIGGLPKKPFTSLLNMDSSESCACQNCNHSDNCQSSGAACCICSNCSLVDQCSKPGVSGCKCSDCLLAANNCCQPGSDNCMCSNCPTQDTCQKGQMEEEGMNNNSKTVANTKRKVVDEDVEIKNLEELKQKSPALYDQLLVQAQTSERNRLKEIDEIGATLDAALVVKAKYEQPMTAQQLAFEALKADAAKGKDFQNVRKQELNSANLVPGATITNNSDEVEADILNKIAAGANLKRKGAKE